MIFKNRMLLAGGGACRPYYIPWARILAQASKSALLEEFLHNTQLKSGLLEKYGNHQALEVHVKDFMLRHAKMLGLDNPNDVRFLQQLKVEEIQRLNNLKR